MKYTPSGGTVKIGIEVDDAAGLARVSVTDTGVGIPEKDLPFIFDRFYRARSREKASSGAGLGLAITRKILEAHGAEITVASKVNEGTTFTFDLPTSS